MYEVTVHGGDKTFGHDSMTVTIEGTQYDLPDTSPMQMISTTFADIAVIDGALTLFFEDQGGSNAYVTLIGLEIVGETGPPLPGDFDTDGDVDGDDLDRWQAGFAMPSGAELGDGDADADTDVDGNDFLAWQRNFDPGPASGSSAASSPSGGSSGAVEEFGGRQVAGASQLTTASTAGFASGGLPNANPPLPASGDRASIAAIAPFEFLAERAVQGHTDNDHPMATTRPIGERTWDDLAQSDLIHALFPQDHPPSKIDYSKWPDVRRPSPEVVQLLATTHSTRVLARHALENAWEDAMTALWPDDRHPTNHES